MRGLIRKEEKIYLLGKEIWTMGSPATGKTPVNLKISRNNVLEDVILMVAPL